MNEYIEKLLLGKVILGNKVITSVNDFIPAERAVGIRNSYAVVTADDDKEYVIFDCGEIQDEIGVVVGKTDLLNCEESW